MQWDWVSPGNMKPGSGVNNASLGGGEEASYAERNKCLKKWEHAVMSEREKAVRIECR